jgi:hypothetical protein
VGPLHHSGGEGSGKRGRREQDPLRHGDALAKGGQIGQKQVALFLYSALRACILSTRGADCRFEGLAHAILKPEEAFVIRNVNNPG